MLSKLHHVAYRCHDAQETVEFYTNVLGLKFAKSIVQDLVPSINKVDPHIHIFFEMEDGSFIAFFDIASSDDQVAEPGRDWAQHLALEVSPDRIEKVVEGLRANNVDFVGPVDHGICESYYFYDPSGNRLECAVRTDSEEMWATSASKAYAQLEAWNAKKASLNTATKS